MKEGREPLVEHIQEVGDVAGPELKIGVLEHKAESHSIQALQGPQKGSKLLTSDSGTLFIILPADINTIAA